MRRARTAGWSLVWMMALVAIAGCASDPIAPAGDTGTAAVPDAAITDGGVDAFAHDASAPCVDECTANVCDTAGFVECGDFDDDDCLEPASAMDCMSANACLEAGCSDTGCTTTPRVCDAPPASSCVDADTLRVHDAVGACTDGACEYASHDVACPSCPACDACEAVACDAPPSVCFASTGTCDEGSCTYAFADGVTCDDGDACTSGDTCASGVCAGSLIACATPPAASCLSGSVVRTYSAGRCMAGACSYPPVDVACAPGEICRSAVCEDRCDFAGAESLLGPTTDSADPPAVAYDSVSDQTLLVRTDGERNEVRAELRAADGTLHPLPELSGVVSDRPMSPATAVADAAGFGIAWLEARRVSGVDTYAFRVIALDHDGAETSDTLFAASGIHYTDVSPRLFSTPSGRVLVYKGRTTTSLPTPYVRYAHVPSGASFQVDAGEPRDVTWDGGAFAQVMVSGSDLVLRRTTDAGVVLDAALPIGSPPGLSGATFIAPAAGGYYLLRGSTLWRIDAAGARVGSEVAVGRFTRALITTTVGVVALGIDDDAHGVLWRIDPSPSLIGTVTVSTATNVRFGLDAAAWTGSEYVVAWVRDAGLADQAAFTHVCLDPTL